MVGEPPDDLMGLGLDMARVAGFHQDSQRVPGRGLGHGACLGQPGRRGQQGAGRVGAVFDPTTQQPGQLDVARGVVSVQVIHRRVLLRDFRYLGGVVRQRVARGHRLPRPG